MTESIASVLMVCVLAVTVIVLIWAGCCEELDRDE